MSDDYPPVYAAAVHMDGQPFVSIQVGPFESDTEAADFIAWLAESDASDAIGRPVN